MLFGFPLFRACILAFLVIPGMFLVSTLNNVQPPPPIWMMERKAFLKPWCGLTVRLKEKKYRKEQPGNSSVVEFLMAHFPFCHSHHRVRRFQTQSTAGKQQCQSSELPLQARVQLQLAKWLPKHSLEQAQSRVLGVEYVRAAKPIVQSLGLDTKHLAVDKEVFYCPSGL